MVQIVSHSKQRMLLGLEAVLFDSSPSMAMTCSSLRMQNETLLNQKSHDATPISE